MQRLKDIGVQKLQHCLNNQTSSYGMLLYMKESELNLRTKVNVHKNRKLNRLGKAIYGLTIAASVTGAGLGQYIYDDALFVPKFIAKNIEDTCPPIPEIKIQDAKNELNGPNKVGLYINSPEYYAYAKQQAEKYGLTLVDATPYLEQIDNAKSTSEILSTLNSYFNQYSVIVEIPENVGIKDVLEGYQPLSEDEKNAEKIKKGVSLMIKSARFIPEEVWKASEVKKIKLIKLGYINDPLGGQSPSTAMAIYTGNNVLFNPLIAGSDDLPHELGHFLMYKACGYGLNHDKQFEKLNPPGTKYGVPSMQWPKLVRRSHSIESSAEDEATILELILTGVITYPNDPPVMQKKEELLSARINEIIGKNITGYYKSISP